MRRERIFWCIVVGLISVSLVWHAWQSAFDHDEIEHVHAAWVVGQGGLPFADFLEQHHPTIWYALGPLMGAMSSPRGIVFLVRIFDLAGLAGFLVLFGMVSRLVYPTLPARWPALLLVSSFTFTRNMMEIRPDPWMNLFVFAGLLLWLQCLQQGSWRRAFFSGLCFGVAMAILQKAAIVVACVGAASLVLLVWRRREPSRAKALLRGGSVALVGAAMPIAILCAAMVRSGLWDDFVFWNYTFNRFFYLQATLREQFSLTKTIGEGFVRNPVLWIAGIAGLIAVARALWTNRRKMEGRCEGQFIVAVVAVGYILFLAKSRMPFDHYLIVWLPLAALCSGEVFQRLRAVGRGAIFEIACVAMAVELVAIVLAYPTSAQSLRIQDYVLARTSPGDAVVIAPPYHPVVRPDGTYFWYNGAMIGKAYEDFCGTQGCDSRASVRDAMLWTTTRPAFVFLDPEYPDHRPYRWGEHEREYEPTEIGGLFRRRK